MKEPHVEGVAAPPRSRVMRGWSRGRTWSVDRGKRRTVWVFGYRPKSCVRVVFAIGATTLVTFPAFQSRIFTVRMTQYI